MIESEQLPSIATPRRGWWFRTPGGAVAGAVLGALIGFALSKSLGLGERLQQMNLTNTGSAAMLVKIDTVRWTGDGEVVIEPGKVGMFMYGEGDKLTIFPGSTAAGAGHSVTLSRKPILAEANADNKAAISFGYKSE